MQRVSVAMAGVVPLLSRFTDARACQCCAWWHAVSVVSRLGVCQNVCQNVCKFGFFGTHFGTLNIILIMCVLSSDRAMHTTIAIMMLHNDTHAYVINHRSYLCLFFSLLRSRLRFFFFSRFRRFRSSRSTSARMRARSAASSSSSFLLR